MKRWCCVLLAYCCVSGLQAQMLGSESGLMTPEGGTLVEPLRQFSDPELERRFHRLSWTLRCMQCDNQAIGDSNAPVSAQMRDRVAELLEAGYSDRAIEDFMIERYGEGVTYRPRLGPHTVWIWLVGAVLVSALLAVFWGLRRHHARTQKLAAEPLSEAEQARLQQLRQSVNKAPNS